MNGAPSTTRSLISPQSPTESMTSITFLALANATSLLGLGRFSNIEKNLMMMMMLMMMNDEDDGAVCANCYVVFLHIVLI